MKVIVIGAGASGLMAAKELSEKGAEVVILERSPRIGGRIHTLVPEGFSNHIEAGAEFIHGNLPLTLQLMKQAKLPYVPVTGNMYRFENGKILNQYGNSKVWDDFYAALENLKKDCALLEFLEINFKAEKYNKLREQVLQMAQGLDLADASLLSVKSIREEWLSEETQYRPSTGYFPLLEFICNKAIARNCQLFLDQEIAEIRWKPGVVSVKTNGQEFTSDAVVVTASLGNLQHSQIRFKPEIPQLQTLFKTIGFGCVIKMVFEFDSIFWERQFPDFGFMFVEDMTFWTQLQQHRPILTGWIGNGYIEKYHELSDQKLIETALSKLQEAFGEIKVRKKLKASKVFRYTNDSESGGGYSWLTTESKTAIKILNKGFENTVWFAGEALHPGAEVGTVEAALQSGRYTARKIVKVLDLRA